MMERWILVLLSFCFSGFVLYTDRFGGTHLSTLLVGAAAGVFTVVVFIAGRMSVRVHELDEYEEDEADQK